MKKLSMLCVALLAVTALSAQIKYDAEGVKKKVEAADAAAQNPKRSTKAATWVNRGDAYYQAAIAPTNGIYNGMTEQDALLLCGKPLEKKTEEVNGANYTVLVYDNYDLYIPEGQTQVTFWKQKTKAVDNGLDVAFDSYVKAAELDPKTAGKVKPSIQKLIDTYKQEGDIAFTGGDYKTAAHAFAKAYDFSVNPLVNEPDTLSAYNAGYVSILAEDFDPALKYLDAAQKLGYENDGELYFLQYHAYNGKKDQQGAENALKTGIQKYPANSKLIESLILHYTTTGQDASQMIPMVQEALNKDPNNFVFHFGLGMIYDKLGNFEKAAEEFKKASELNPKDFSSFFNLGITYVRHGEALAKELSDIPVSKQAEYDAKLAEINTLYKESMPYLLKAYELNPKERTTVELLKSLYFRFRDESPEMMQNYEKFNQILQTM